MVYVNEPYENKPKVVSKQLAERTRWGIMLKEHPEEANLAINAVIKALSHWPGFESDPYMTGRVTSHLRDGTETPMDYKVEF